jgi:hypothetical protein
MTQKTRAQKEKDAALRRLLLMSFKGMGKSIRMIGRRLERRRPSLIVRMSFQLAIP